MMTHPPAFRKLGWKYPSCCTVLYLYVCGVSCPSQAFYSHPRFVLTRLLFALVLRSSRCLRANAVPHGDVPWHVLDDEIFLGA